MANEYKAQRLVSVMSALLGILILYTMLTYFGVIQQRGEFCEGPEVITCFGQEITITSVSFTLRSTEDLRQVQIVPSSQECDLQELPIIAKNSERRITITCDATAPKGNMYRETILLTYSEGTSIVQQREEITLRGEVIG